MLQADPTALDIAMGWWSMRPPGASASASMKWRAIAYFRPDTLPPGFQAELAVTRHLRAARLSLRLHQRNQASYVEVDVETGMVRLLGTGWSRIAAR
jgi:aerobic carbon-monoxide dehydrogenase large subunit